MREGSEAPRASDGGLAVYAPVSLTDDGRAQLSIEFDNSSTQAFAGDFEQP